MNQNYKLKYRILIDYSKAFEAVKIAPEWVALKELEMHWTESL